MHYTQQTYTIHAPKPYLFIGSKIRGMFGYALKNEVCINPNLQCKGCFSAKSCLFYQLYEQKNTTQNFRLDFELFQQEFSFSLLLFGNLQHQTSLLHQAMLQALGEYEVSFFSKEHQTPTITNTPKKLKLSFVTPLRMKKNNKFAKDNITLLDILLSIHKRATHIQQLPYQKIHLDTNYTILSQELYYQELLRKSNRQKTKMYLGGIMGEMVVQNISQKAYELLKLGEVIGVGKSTTFGLGKIKLEELV